jgi:hypothetical protein
MSTLAVAARVSGDTLAAVYGVLVFNAGGNFDSPSAMPAGLNVPQGTFS